ncbi:SUKH-4 family immunity protein [Streptomyces sp. NBC_00885]|uniref:SUKH-4 family immunity protein n=1 Tax=Streptomyces sp. NBC_00885 TaxID=2975857 RepID=UPI003868BEC2|nr:SUKH-4 family immunity protein [Streptomyces sp. NBC_00885]
MATREELINTFGESNVVTADRQVDSSVKFSPQDSEILFAVGLPARVPGVFQLATKETPQAFTIIPVQSGESRLNLLCIGAPNYETGLRYCLDLEHGFTLLVDLEDGEVEVVNESLPKFLEFLFRVERFTFFKANSTKQQAKEHLHLLRDYLKLLDSHALHDPTGWWSMIFDQGL